MLALTFCAYCLHAQKVDTLRPNPRCIVLYPSQYFWYVEGDGYGAAFGPLGDIFHTGASAWAVYLERTPEWRIYSWNPIHKTYHEQRFIDYRAEGEPLSPLPVVGDFFGTDTLLVLLQRDGGIYHFLQARDSVLDTIPRIDWRLNSASPTGMFILDGAAAADLDGDGADELVLLSQTSYRNRVPSNHQEIWIYRGGSNFTLDSPTVVLRDTLSFPSANGQVALMDADGDHRLDILTYTNLPVPRVTTYFADSLLWNWPPEHRPDRVLLFPDMDMEFGQGDDPQVVFDDYDGDSTTDLLVARSGKVALYRSRPGKSWRTRTFDLLDADNIYIPPALARPVSVGSMTDSTGRCATMGLLMSIDPGYSVLYLFSSDSTGPDGWWDAREYGFYGRIRPALDCNGDGWGDFMMGDTPFQSIGICSIFLGGPQIPHDTAASVEWVAVSGEHSKAIAVWPNPAREVVHIAWRGDLKRRPHRFVVHDMRGDLVAEGIADNSGEVVWDCAARANGNYLCTVLDRNGATIATTRLLIEH